MPEPLRDTTCAIEPGTVGLFEGRSEDWVMAAVLLSFQDETAIVVPVSAELEAAAEWDLLLPPEVLGYDAVAQVWNYGTVLPEQCIEIAGALPEASLVQLRELASAAATGKAFERADLVGPPIVGEEDPRILNQDAQAELAKGFWEPALVLAGAATFGELIRHRRVELDLDVGVLEEATCTSGWAEGVERDAVDLRQVFEPDRFAALLDRLRLGASRRLRGIVRTTLEATAPQTARGANQLQDQLIDPEVYLDRVFDELSRSRP